MINRHETRVFAAIVSLAAFLRLFRLDNLPPSLFRDEAEKIMNALSLAERGTDLQGNSWPLFIKVFSVTTSAIYQYLAAFFVMIIGEANEWTARLPATFAGTATVVFVWMAVRKIYGFHAAVLAASLLALSAWHIPLSRWAHQGILVPLFISVLLWALASLEKQRLERSIKYWPAIVGGIAGGLAFYTYDIARLILPSLGLVAALFWYKVLIQKPILFIVAGTAFTVAAAPALHLLLTDQTAAQTRFRFVTIAQPGLTMFEILGQFALNYVQHWTPDFLLFFGDKNLRHGSGVGILNPLEILAPFILVLYIYRNPQDAFAKFTLAGILLYPVASSLTRVDVPHALRSINGIPFFAIAAGIALPWLYPFVPIKFRNPLVIVLALMAIASIARFHAVYFGPTYRKQSAQYWEYGIRQALDVTNQPILKPMTVVFDNILGYEYLAPFYLGLNAEQTSTFSVHPRYKMRFRDPSLTPPAGEISPTLYLTFPGQSWPSQWRGMPITVDSADQQSPAFLIIFNSPAWNQFAEHHGLQPKPTL